MRIEIAEWLHRLAKVFLSLNCALLVTNISDSSTALVGTFSIQVEPTAYYFRGQISLRERRCGDCFVSAFQSLNFTCVTRFTSERQRSRDLLLDISKFSERADVMLNDKCLSDTAPTWVHNPN